MTEETRKRRNKEKKINYTYEKFGASGVFATETSLPIEYLLTSIPINQIEDLSFARDVQSKVRNFDYLIQRDIDEERARKDICTYLAESEQGKAIFLPPLIAAVVGVDNNNLIEDFYPNCHTTLDGKELTEKISFEDEQELIREWPGLFKISAVVDETAGVKLFSDNQVKNIPIDIQQVNFKMRLTQSTAGGRLVVIDGQHRLFALKYLLKNEPEKVKNLTIPLCILFSPISTNENYAQNNNVQTVTSVLRRLFVDVNSTVEKVSGHFLTLLSDDNLGSIICREFCSRVHNEASLNDRGLGLVEWNTKNNKESKTISRIHSITSIGVIYDCFEKLFYSKKGVETLKDFLDLSDITLNSTDSENNDYLPWTGFNNEYKNILRDLVKKEIVENLYTLFFLPDVYKKSVDIFNELLNVKLEEIKNKRDATSDCVPYLTNYFLYNDPIPDIETGVSTKYCKNILKTLNQWCAEQLSMRSNTTAFLSIYQKSVIIGWVDLYLLCKSIGLTKEIVTNIYVRLMNISLKSELNLFEYSQQYMQDNIYSGPRVKATTSSINQFKNLTLSFLGNEPFLTNLKTEYNLSSQAIDFLKQTGKECASLFFKKLILEKEKSFSKNYKHNYSLTQEQKKELSDAENKRNSEIYSTDDSSTKVEAAVTFDNLIKAMIKTDLKECAQILSMKLGYSDFFYLVESSDNEDYA